ncbi:MAG: YHS domain-containing protein [Desulfuromonadales bacterium]|nr:YHS domain-containing protein [Desulfuromonadales bacterium]
MRLLLWGLLLYFGYRIVMSLTQPRTSRTAPPTNRENVTTTHKDPVCGMYVSEEDAVVGNHNGQRLYFCSRTCLDKYKENLDHTQT